MKMRTTTLPVPTRRQASLPRLKAIAGATPMLSDEQERFLLARWIERRDTKAAERLVASHLRLVFAVASRYRGYRLSLDDLVAEGNVGLLEALNRFDPAHEARLSTYAVKWIDASIKAYVLRFWSLVRIGTTRAEKRLFFRLRGLTAALEGRAGGEPLPDAAATIAAQVGVSREAVLAMATRLSGTDVSLNAPVTDATTAEMQDLLADDAASPEQELADKDEMWNRRRLFTEAMKRLDPREREIFTERRLREKPATAPGAGDAVQYFPRAGTADRSRRTWQVAKGIISQTG
jgi:RNA polymerase sigma-32 factor